MEKDSPATPAPIPPSATAADPDARAAALITAFLSGRNPRTLRAYRQDLDDFRAFVRSETAEAAAGVLLSRGQGGANAVALAYRAHLRERGLQAATINRRLAALRSLVKLARILGMVPWGLDVENVRSEPYRDTRGPGRDAVERLLVEAEKKQTPKSLRDRAIIRLLYDLGLRRGEIVGLDVSDVDMPRGVIAVQGKGRTQRELLTLPATAKAALSDWMAARGAQPGALFISFDRAGKGEGRLDGSNIYRMVRALGTAVGVQARPHGLRHTAITEACKQAQANGIGLDEVAQFSRHRDLRTMLIYRDRERDVQGLLAELITSQPPKPSAAEAESQ